MADKIYRTVNGRTDTKLVSAAQAAKMVARGWLRDAPEAEKPAKKRKAKANADKA